MTVSRPGRPVRRPPAGPGRGVAVAALLGAMTGGATAQAPAFPRLGPDVEPGRGRVQECSLVDVDGPVRCGTFRVDEDGEPGGRTLDLRFVVLGALEEDAAPDPILVFTGGPGAATIPSAQGLARAFRPLRLGRDLLLVDLRGIGFSAALDCDVPYPGGLASRFGSLFPPEHIRSCRDTLARRADLRAYTTAASVDDLEALRSWLGYPVVNLHGGSYGTRVAQVYMRRHPGSVRTAILNGVTPLEYPGYVRMARALQDALDRLVEECEADAACGRAFPRFRAQLDRLLGQFDEGPVPVTVQGRTFPFSAGNLGYALRGLLYARAGEIPYLVDRADRQGLDEIVDYYLARTAWVGTSGGGAGNHLSVICAEDIAPVTDDDVREATRGTFLGDWVIRGYREACALWPHAELPPGFFRPVTSDVPTLLLSGGRDPATPPAGGERVAAHLSHSLHVVVPNGGHGVFDRCTLGMIVRLVEDGSLDRVDPSCVEAAPPTRFRTPGE